MFCPKCLKEFPEHYDLCPVCETKLIYFEDLENTDDPMELVTVFKTEDAGLIPIVKSLLSDANIPYTLKSDGLQTLYAFGVTGFSVLKSDENSAKEVLKELELQNME